MSHCVFWTPLYIELQSWIYFAVAPEDFVLLSLLNLNWEDNLKALHHEEHSENLYDTFSSW